MRSRLQDQRRATGARRHVGHAPKLRREQRAGGLLEASHTFLTTASAADHPAFDGYVCRRFPDTLSTVPTSLKLRRGYSLVSKYAGTL